MAIFLKSMMKYLLIALIFCSCTTKTYLTVIESRTDTKFLKKHYNRLNLRVYTLDEIPTDTCFKMTIRKSKDSIDVGEFYWYTKKEL